MSVRDTAVEYYNRAISLASTDPSMAYRHLCSAVTVDPTFAEGWVFLGENLSSMGSLPAALTAFRRALTCSPEPLLRHRALVQLGHRLLDNRVVTLAGLEEADRVTSEAIAAQDVSVPGQAFAWTNRSLIASLLNHADEELDAARRGYEMFPEPATELGLAFACLFNGHYADGLRHFDARFPHALPQYLNLPWPRWDGGHVETLLVLCEQGLGDTVSMAPWVADARARVCHVLFQVQPELLRLMTRALAPYENVTVVPRNHELPVVDAWCPVFSLPVPMGDSDEGIRERPPLRLHVPPVENRSWKRKDARKHVAIAWAGAPANAIDPHRSIPFEMMLPLCEIPGVAVYSVQVGDRARELHDRGAAALVSDMSPWIRDAADTAGILAEMDHIVCCESFVGHLAGAMDVPTLLLCSRLGRDWRSSPRLGGRTLWYPRTEVIRQGDDCDWRSVVAEAVERLR